MESAHTCSPHDWLPVFTSSPHRSSVIHPRELDCVHLTLGSSPREGVSALCSQSFPVFLSLPKPPHPCPLPTLPSALCPLWCQSSKECSVWASHSTWPSLLVSPSLSASTRGPPTRHPLQKAVVLSCVGPTRGQRQKLEFLGAKPGKSPGFEALWSQTC